MATFSLTTFLNIVVHTFIEAVGFVDSPSPSTSTMTSIIAIIFNIIILNIIIFLVVQIQVDVRAMTSIIAIFALTIWTCNVIDSHLISIIDLSIMDLSIWPW
jgi:hypothetical protein